MANLKEIRDQIKIDSNVLSDPNFPDVRLNNIVNQAQRYVQTELNGLGMKKWEAAQGYADLTSDTFAGVNVKTLAVPTDMLESPKSIIQIEVDDAVGGAGMAKEVSQGNLYDLLGNTFLIPTIKQAVFARINNKIYFAPSTVGEGTIHYYRRVTELSIDSTESEIPEEFTEYVVRRAVSQIDKILGRLNEAIAKEKDLSNDIAEAYNKFVGKMNTEKSVEKLQ